jgi:hypothetical protein
LRGLAARKAGLFGPGGPGDRGDAGLARHIAGGEEGNLLAMQVSELGLELYDADVTPGISALNRRGAYWRCGDPGSHHSLRVRDTRSKSGR